MRRQDKSENIRKGNILLEERMKNLKEINVVDKIDPDELDRINRKPSKFNPDTYEPSDKSHSELAHLGKTNDKLRKATKGQFSSIGDMIPQDNVDTLRKTGVDNDRNHKLNMIASQAVRRSVEDNEGDNYTMTFTQAFGEFKREAIKQGIEVNFERDKNYIKDKLDKYVHESKDYSKLKESFDETFNKIKRIDEVKKSDYVPQEGDIVYTF
tara:strand:+ start:738 stop:1370 length:633 start_codon:yes stop_codon:yes gene_type:complete